MLVILFSMLFKFICFFGLQGDMRHEWIRTCLGSRVRGVPAPPVLNMGKTSNVVKGGAGKQILVGSWAEPPQNRLIQSIKYLIQLIKQPIT